MPWNSPHDVDRFALVIPLQLENTWTFGILWIILNHSSIPRSCEDVPDKDVIVSQLIVAMIRNADFSPCDEVKD
jgi:hypothetical protein